MRSGSLRPASQRSLCLGCGRDSNALHLRAQVTSLVEMSSLARLWACAQQGGRLHLPLPSPLPPGKTSPESSGTGRQRGHGAVSFPRWAAAPGTGHKPVGCRGPQGLGLVTYEDSFLGQGRGEGPQRPHEACQSLQGATQRGTVPSCLACGSGRSGTQSQSNSLWSVGPAS